MDSPNDERTPPASFGLPGDATWYAAASETGDLRKVTTSPLRASATNSPTQGQIEIPVVCEVVAPVPRYGRQLRSQSAADHGAPPPGSRNRRPLGRAQRCTESGVVVPAQTPRDSTSFAVLLLPPQIRRRGPAPRSAAVPRQFCFPRPSFEWFEWPPAQLRRRAPRSGAASGSSSRLSSLRRPQGSGACQVSQRSERAEFFLPKVSTVVCSHPSKKFCVSCLAC